MPLHDPIKPRALAVVCFGVGGAKRTFGDYQHADKASLAQFTSVLGQNFTSEKHWG